jgi:hypothetical protein
MALAVAPAELPDLTARLKRCNVFHGGVPIALAADASALAPSGGGDAKKAAPKKPPKKGGRVYQAPAAEEEEVAEAGPTGLIAGAVGAGGAAALPSQKRRPGASQRI